MEVLFSPRELKEVIVVKGWPFRDEVPLDALLHVLAEQQITRMWELRGLARLDQYEIEPASLRLLDGFNAREVWWTPQEMDWLLYSSHEGSLTIAGDSMVAAMKAIWPEWEQHLFVNEWH